MVASGRTTKPDVVVRRSGTVERVRARGRRIAAGYRGFRSSVARNRTLDVVFKVVVGLRGFVVVVVGIIALPAPGPGWAIIFVGLGILATEFTAARKALRFVRRRYDAWVAWPARQNHLVRAGVSLAVVLVIVTCGWLVGAFAVVGGCLGLEWAWLRSPRRGLMPA